VPPRNVLALQKKARIISPVKRVVF
jgi:hypothetical protein